MLVTEIMQMHSYGHTWATVGIGVYQDIALVWTLLYLYSFKSEGNIMIIWPTYLQKSFCKFSVVSVSTLA